MILSENDDQDSSVILSDGFWFHWMEIVASSLVHQWERLEEFNTIDNFRIVARLKQGFREGFFYTDSDAYKWGEAACRVINYVNNSTVFHHLEEFIQIILKAHSSDGYIYTYNQFHFPRQRFENLLIEHELYCMGHLIEFAIAHYLSTKSRVLLDLAIKIGDLIYQQFINGSPADIPGHEEIEIALMKLYRVTKNIKYLELSQHFLENRGRDRFFFYHLIRQNISHSRKEKIVNIQKEKYYSGDEQPSVPKLFEGLEKQGPPFLKIRSYFSFLTGKYFQANKPLRQLTKPIGHSVRWGYLATAATMLYKETGDSSLLQTLEKAWDNMVQKRMYVTGGLGSLPLIEGFGRDYELEPRYAYCETCAAIASIYWNWELFQSTKKAKYIDLLEWQLYNAMLVGLSLDGKSFFYRNPLEVEGLERKPWYLTACCPPNIARTIAKVPEYIYSSEGNNVWINLFISSKALLSNKHAISIDSSLPFGEKVVIKLQKGYNYYLRIPSWSSKTIIRSCSRNEPITVTFPSLSFPLDPYKSTFIKLTDDEQIEVSFDFTPRIHYPHKRDKYKKGKIALSRGPIIYCFESVDNPHLDFNETVLDLNEPFGIDYLHFSDSLNVPVIVSKTTTGDELIAIPYFLWGNRNNSKNSNKKMTVWIRAKK